MTFWGPSHHASRCSCWPSIIAKWYDCSALGGVADSSLSPLPQPLAKWWTTICWLKSNWRDRDWTAQTQFSLYLAKPNQTRMDLNFPSCLFSHSYGYSVHFISLLHIHVHLLYMCKCECVWHCTERCVCLCVLVENVNVTQQLDFLKWHEMKGWKVPWGLHELVNRCESIDWTWPGLTYKIAYCQLQASPVQVIHSRLFTCVCIIIITIFVIRYCLLNSPPKQVEQEKRNKETDKG